MISGLKPYAQMKTSDVSGVDAVPSHWRVRKLRSVLSPVTERNRPDLPLLSVVRERGVVLRDTENKEENHNFIPDDLSNYKVVRAGQFAMNKMKAWQGSYGVSRHDGIVSPAYFTFGLSGVEGNFFHLAIRSSAYVPFFTRASDGVRVGQWDLSQSRMKEIPFLIPPPEEQAAIVRFLDHANRRIRRALATKQKLIRLLEEQKRAIIHRAVTRGLDPDARLKSSGIEWLDDVPSHWGVLALKRVLRRLVDCEHKTAPAVDESDFRVIRTSAVKSGRIRWEGTYCTTPEAFSAWTQRAIPEAGDVIFTREAPVGEACVIPPKCAVCLGQRTVLMKVDHRQYRPEFLVHMIYEGPPRTRIRLASQGSTVGHFNMDDIGWMPVLRPPVPEQDQILEFIRGETLGIERAIVTADREIQLLREYRTRLFADVVTGKIDVREAVATLPGLIEPEGNELDDDEEGEFDSIEDIAIEEQAA